MEEANKEAPETTTPDVSSIKEEKSGPTLADLRMGYVVGVTEDGNFVFEIVGKEQGLVELLGLHRFAESKINNVLDTNQNQGNKILFEIGRTVTVLAQEVSKLVTILKKPDNNLKK